MHESENAARIPQDLAAGLFLVVIASLALWRSSELDVGTLGTMGPGMLPRALGVLSGVAGIVIAVRPYLTRTHPDPLGVWSFRGALFILAAALAFATTIRPLGFTAAGPLAIVLAALASKETRPLEVAIFAVVMTASCVLLFRVLLSLPIPVAPWLLDY